MGGMQKCFIKGLGTTHDKIHQLEEEYSSLINRTYTFGENATPYSINGKKIYMYMFNPNQELELPSRGNLVLINNVEYIISETIFVKSPFGDGATQNKWYPLPLIKRNDADTQISTIILENNNYGFSNYTVTGRRNFKGFVYYTKNE